MAKIDHTNYATTLKQSTNPRGSSPNGNVYFDVANNKIQMIGVDELPTITYPVGHPGYTDGNPVPNPYSRNDGFTLRALYRFEGSRRRDEASGLRGYERLIKGSYRFAGAYNFINGGKLDGTDRAGVRDSGWIEYANQGDGQSIVDRIYHGVQSLNSIQPGTQPYWALVTVTDEAALQAATWANFVRTGSINEAVQVFGDSTYDAGAGDFDYTARKLVARVRSWQYNGGETTSVASGISEFSGFSAGYGVGETANANNTYLSADVYGGAQVAPWTGMSLELLAVAQNEGGFVGGGTAPFSWILHNTGGVPGVPGTVEQCAAFLDALALQDATINTGVAYNGKKGRIWYSRDSSGRVVTSTGLFIEGLSTLEKQNAVMTDNNGVQKTYPYYPTIEIDPGAAAIADTLAWFHVFYNEGTGVFDSATAFTVTDALGAPMKGVVSSSVNGSNKIALDYDFDGNTENGTGSGSKDMVVLVEGDGGAAQAIAYFTVTRIPLVQVTCAPASDTNA